MTSPLLHDAEHIARYFQPLLTPEGVLDPDEERVLEHAYATAFYAWLCALLSEHDPAWIDTAIQATEAELCILERWFTRRAALSDTPYFHWEFKNLALLHVEKRLRGKLPPELVQRLQAQLQRWHDLDIDSANWTAMRMVNYALRHQLHPSRLDHLRSLLEMQRLLGMQSAEGFFPDTPESYSFQYHAYVLALIVLYHRLTPGSAMKDALLNGVRVIAHFINPDGDFNYYGRGQRQLFGYAALILALREAAHLTDDEAECQQWHTLAARVHRYVTRYRMPNGVFPIVLNTAPMHERVGWYNYNNTGDYLIFCGVMFALAHPHGGGAYDLNPEASAHAFPDLGLAVVAAPETFTVFGRGSQDESEPSGLVHHWPEGPLCLGGPDAHKAAGLDYGRNAFGPRVNGEALLHHTEAAFSVSKETLRIHTTAASVTVSQKVVLGQGKPLTLAFEVAAEHPVDVQFAAPHHAFDSAPNSTEQTISPAGEVPLHLSSVYSQVSTWEQTLTLSSAADLPTHWQVTRHKKTQHRFAFIHKVIWIIWVNLVRQYRLNRDRRG